MLSEVEIIAAWKQAGYKLVVSHRYWHVTLIVKQESARWILSTIPDRTYIGGGSCGTKGNSPYVRRRKNLQAAVKCATLHRIKK